VDKIKNWTIKILKIIISLSLMAYLLYKNDWKYIIIKITSIETSLFLYALLLIVIIVPLLVSLRWKILVQSEKSISFTDIIKLSYTGLFFSLILPGSVGGDAIKGALFYKKTRNSAIATSSIILDRIIGLIGLTILSAIASAVYYKMTEDMSFSLESGGFLIILVLFLVFFSLSYIQKKFLSLLSWLKLEKLRDFTEKNFDYLSWLKGHPKILLSTLGISFAAQSIGIYACFLIGISLGIHVSIGYYFLFVPIISLISSLPISISGIGVRESSFVYFFLKIGILQADSMSLSIIFFSLGVISGLMGGIIYLMSSFEPVYKESQ
jgi:uncharacterized protein (TIRG00374 family)